jgi:ribonuclease D
MHSYYEKMCLVQISDGRQHFLVDPLAGLDLRRFFRLLETREMVLHDCDFDLSIIRRTLPRFQPGQVFDTMLAARFCGYRSFGLAALVEEFFGVELEKESQRCDWSQRPLSEQMKRYAIGDVFYLIPLRDALLDQLKHKQRLDWYQQTLERNITEILNRPETPADNAFWRLNKKPRFRGRQLAILKAVWQWREDLARDLDRPPFKVLRGHEVVNVVYDTEKGKKPRLYGRAKKGLADLERAIETAGKLPEEKWPSRDFGQSSRPSPEEEKVFQKLKNHRNQVSERHDLEPGLACPNAKLQALARDPESVADELLPWQQEILALNSSEDVRQFRDDAGA